MSLLEKIGTKMSENRVVKNFHDIEGKKILDIGCGYNALLSARLAKKGAYITSLDIKLNAKLNELRNIHPLEGTFEEHHLNFFDNYFDAVLLISVLEHLDNPVKVLRECHRILKPDGKLLINVPTWRGKKFLEMQSFVLDLAPMDEINDHKMYYDVRNLWPILIKAGFKPIDIEIKHYKLGLNLFAVARK